MLTDPIYLYKPTGDQPFDPMEPVAIEGYAPFALIDAATPGRTVRAGVLNGLNSTLTISRSETKENKPVGTKRTSLFLASNKTSEEAGTVSGFVQLTVGLPKAGFTVAELRYMCETLCSLALAGLVADTMSPSAGGGLALLNRLVAGEG